MLQLAYHSTAVTNVLERHESNLKRNSWSKTNPQNLDVVPRKMPDKKVPQPGPAKIGLRSGPDEWLLAALSNQFLPEWTMKKLTEICKELLMEGKSCALSGIISH